jgi:tyrosine-protein kinase Etk/Wzc
LNDEARSKPRSHGAMPHREIHVKDLWAVVVRHWKLVALLSVVVAAFAYLNGRRSVTRYQSGLTVQVSSSKQVFARTDDIDVDELSLKTDPIQSEALVLTTQAVALQVVHALSLQLDLADPSSRRSELLSAVAVDSPAPPGRFTLETHEGNRVRLRDAGGDVVAIAAPGEPIVGPGFSFTVLPQGQPVRVEFRILTPQVAAAMVTGGLSYRVRESTNAVDIWYAGTDPTLVPRILNQAALELRNSGAERARQAAAHRRRYVEEQLARAEQASRDKFRELQSFKESQRITDLGAEEHALVQSIRDFELQRQEVRLQIATLEDALGARDTIGIEALSRLASVQGIGANSALNYWIQQLLELHEERRNLTSGALGFGEANPQVRGVDQRVRQAQASLRSAVTATLETLGRRERALLAKTNELRNELMTFPGMETRIAQLQLESSILENTHRYLLGQYQQAQLQEATITPYVSILDGASPPWVIGTNLKQRVILGFLVGMLLGLGGAFFLEYLDQTIKTAADVERAVGMPVLGLIPHDASTREAANGRRKPLVIMTQLGSDDAAVEAYRSLRTNVTFVGAERPLQMIAVTSPGPGEGKSTTAANLALTLAHGGSHTLLVDGDLRRPLQHRAFGIVQEPGLTDVLVGHAPAREAIRPNVAENLDVLPSGALPPNPAELLGSDAMQRLVGELRRDYAYIVIDTPPALPVTDATIAATIADATMLVMRSGETEEAAAQRAVEQLRRVRARIAGVVLNGITPRHDQYYTYYSYTRGTRDRAGRRKSWKATLANTL